MLGMTEPNTQAFCNLPVDADGEVLHASNPLRLPKSEQYYDWGRPQIITLVQSLPNKPKRVVELGCAGGQFGERVKRDLGTEHYTGIELDPTAAARARERLDVVHCVDLNVATPKKLGVPLGTADFLFCLDILEHLVNPWDVLARWATVLQPGGTLVLSIPNIQYAGTISQLIAGNFDYLDEGILDATHLRFFAHRGAYNLVRGAGFEVQLEQGLSVANFDWEKMDPEDNQMEDTNCVLKHLSRAKLRELFSLQYYMVCKRTGTAPIVPRPTAVDSSFRIGRTPKPSANR
jgi:2-polyprenyl-3-methyl-5-hydroxy-6-metoxy-1,4-benzoquinol methylase